MAKEPLVTIMKHSFALRGLNVSIMSIDYHADKWPTACSLPSWVYLKLLGLRPSGLICQFLYSVLLGCILNFFLALKIASKHICFQLFSFKGDDEMGILPNSRKITKALFVS